MSEKFNDKIELPKATFTEATGLLVLLEIGEREHTSIAKHLEDYKDSLQMRILEYYGQKQKEK
jgi:hypothetical protein